jgi:hypothetical protein
MLSDRRLSGKPLFKCLLLITRIRFQLEITPQAEGPVAYGL